MKTFFQILLVICLSIFTVKPLFGDGFFPVHDDTQLTRVIELNKALIDGHFPVRWSHDLGYGFGYPLFNFYAPLPYYFGAVTMFIVKDALLSTKLMYGIGIISAGIFMFLLVRELISSYAGIASSILYMYAPYHAVQIYVRGSVGEYWAYALLPAVIWGFTKVVKSEKIKWVIITSLFLNFLILSHNIISMLFIAFLLLIFSIFRFKQCIISVILGLLLSAFFWMPAYFESAYTQVYKIIQGGSVFSDHFLYLDQLWDSPWGFAGSAPGRQDGMSFKLGKQQVILGLMGIFVFYYLSFHKKISKKDLYFGSVFIFLMIASTFMVLPLSQNIWKLLLFLLKFVQFPWRFTVFILFSLSLFAGYILKPISSKTFKLVLSTVLVMAVIIINSKYFKPSYIYKLNTADYLNSFYSKWFVSKISDEYLPLNFAKPENTSFLSDDLFYGSAYFKHKMIEDKTGVIRFTLDLDASQNIVINKTFFPGWVGYIDGKHTKISENKGLISINVPKGVHELTIILKSTNIQLIANSISALTLLYILIISSKKLPKIRI